MIDDLWYKNAIVYCLDVETFMDSNCDGIGDFEGLERRMGYLAGLGVTCVWLLPFNPTPNRDNGYDISDYYGVDSRFGSLGDFVEFTHHARKHGIRVIMDLVVNHTSDQHPWFQAARKDPSSRFRDYYVWSKKRPPDANKGMVFPGVQKTTWTRDPVAGEYYFHRFYDFQPDLNTQNPQVQAEIRKIMGYWIELGVSGFRVDALPFVIGTKGAGVKSEPQFDFLRQMRDFLQWRKGDSVLLAEANILPDQNLAYFGKQGDLAHMIFNFQVNQHLFLALATGDARPIAKALKATQIKGDFSQWAHFLRNNDELDLGRLEDDERQAVFDAFGPDPSMQLYDRGIRRRFGPMIGGSRQMTELAYSLMFALPGTPVLRYGDEIGMGDNLKLPERQCGRTPMQWSSDDHGGFSEAEKTVLPVIDKGPFGYKSVNVADQRLDPGSLLNWTERLIRMRKETPEVGWGTCKVVPSRRPSLLVLECEWRGNRVITVHNLSGKVQEASFVVEGSERRLSNLLTNQHSEADKSGKHTIELEPYGYRWFRVGGMIDLMLRKPR